MLLMLAVAASSDAQNTDIGAIGRITPKNGVVLVTCVAGNIIDSINVRAGDTITRGTTMIILRAEENLRLDLESAQSAVREANEMGQMAIEMQRLKIKEATQDLEYAKTRYERFKEIGGDTISKQQMEEREYQVQSASLALDAAQKELARIEGEQKYRQARASQNLKMAEYAMKRLLVEAPVNGTVIEIIKHPGDRTDGSPVAQIADLSVMMVVAEVFEGDVKKLATGMKAKVTSNALSGELTGHVESISPVIERETKIARVHIVLDDPKEASRFINMETNVVIESK